MHLFRCRSIKVKILFASKDFIDHKLSYTTKGNMSDLDVVSF